jgi:hypothetical protein
MLTHTIIKGRIYGSPTQQETVAAGLQFTHNPQYKHIEIAVEGPRIKVSKFVARYPRWRYNVIITSSIKG